MSFASLYFSYFVTSSFFVYRVCNVLASYVFRSASASRIRGRCVGTGRFVATQAYPGGPLSRGRVAVLDCVPAPAGPVQNGVSGAAAVRFLRVGPALSIGAFARL
jgi:uncharacterized membrane protein YraQ (UPF0718 family)